MKKLPKRIWVVAEPFGLGENEWEFWAAPSKKEALAFVEGIAEDEKLGPVLYERVDKE